MGRAAILAALMLAVAGLGLATTGGATASTAGSTTSETGNLLVLLDQQGARAAGAQLSVDAAVARVGGEPAGKSVPEIGLVTVRPPAGESPATFAAVLRRVPGVASVVPEHRYVPRSVPDDPALSVRDPSNGLPWQWYLPKEGFYGAWSISKGNRAVIAVIDTGIDGTHPDLKPKIAAAIDQQSASDDSGPATTDQVGHGTHVASLACAGTDNQLGLAGAGYGCRMLIEKTDFSDSSIASSIVNATNRHADAINMSFGPSVPTAAAAPASEVRALRYAAARKVVLVAAASDSPGTEQGDPANVLQPAGTGPNINKGLGLDVTAAQYSGSRSPFAGSGSEISLAAYGAFKPFQGGAIPCTGTRSGIFGAFPGNATQLERAPASACRVDFAGDDRYATIAGTSMAAPQVAAVGAMMRVLNPYASLTDILRTIKRTARRPAHAGWNPNLGWGILNADAALEAIRRVDRLAPISRLKAPPVSRRRSFLLTWTAHDQQRPQLIASGIAYFKLYVSVDGGRRRQLTRTSGHQFRFTGAPGHRYRFFLFAFDRAGNKQLHAARAGTFVATGAAAFAGTARPR